MAICKQCGARKAGFMSDLCGKCRNSGDEPAYPSASQPAPNAGAGTVLGYPVGEWITAGVVGVLLISLLIGFKACSSSSSAPESAAVAAPSGTTNTAGAWAYMQEFVKQRLKSPVTADFPFGGHRDVEALGDNRYLVNSYVDSQNSFGAQVRTRFSGVITETPTGWKLESLDLQQ